MSQTRFVRVLCLACLIGLAPAHSASPAPQGLPTFAPRPIDDSALREANAKANEQKGRALVESALSQYRALRLPENRVFVLIRAAEILWISDEKRGRDVYQQATEGLVALIKDLDPADPRFSQAFQLHSNLRNLLIQAVERRDPALALETVRATRMPPRQAGLNQPNPETQMELRVASQFISKDPELALKMGREGLEQKGFQSAVNLVSQLSNSDRPRASILAGDLLASLKKTDLLVGYEPLSVVAALLNMEQARNGAQPANKPPVVTDSMVTELIELLMSTMANNSGKPVDPQALNTLRNTFNNVQNFKGLVEKYAPWRVADLQRISGELDAAGTPQEKAYRDMDILRQKGTVDDMLAAVQRMPPEVQAEMYRQVAYKAMNDGNFERGRQIATEYLTDPGQRASMLTEIDRQAASRAGNSGKLDEARQYISRLRSPDDRMRAIIQLASSASNRDKGFAVLLLNEAMGMLGPRIDTQTQLEGRTQIANVFARVDASRAFDVLQPIADQLDGILAAAEVMDQFEQRGGFRDMEMMMHSGNVASRFVNPLAETLATLAQVDFDRTKSFADRFQREEVRMMLRLRIAQAAFNRNNPAITTR